MAETILDAFKAKDTPFLSDWLKSKGLHKLCSVFEGIKNHLYYLRHVRALSINPVTDMEAEKIIESSANYIWFLRVPNAVWISHLLLIDRRAPVDLWRHKCAFLVAFNLEKLIIVVNSITRIRAGTCLGLTSETAICNNLTAKVSVKCIKWFSICASLKLTDLISLISMKVRSDHRSKFSNLSNWKEEAWKKLENLLRWSHFTFIYNRSTNMNYFI